MSPFAQTLFAGGTARKSAALLLDKHASKLNILTFGLIVAVCLLYVAQMNGAVTKGFEMRDLETRIHGLSLENQRLELVARKAQSLEQVASNVKMLGLVEAGAPEYLSGNDPAFALAQ